MWRLLIPAALAASSLAQEPVRALIVTGHTDLPYHHWEETTPFLRDLLSRAGRFSVKVVEEPRGLSGAALEGYDLIVVNYNGPRWGGEAERAVEAFVRAGRGLLSFHQCSYGEFFGQRYEKRWTRGPDDGWRGWADLLGAAWEPKNIGHAPRGVFTVNWVNRSHPVNRDLDASFVANDELYHRLDLKPSAQVLATAFDDPNNGGTGNHEPVIWTVPFGAGRTAHLTLGHDVSAMHEPGFRAAFLRLAEWAATGRVALPSRTAEPDRARVLVVTGGHSYPATFYSLFEGWDDMTWSHAATEKEAFQPGLKNRFETIVLHDMRHEIGESERASLRAFIEAGKGVVSIHHSIVDYTSWPWWRQEVTGGQFFTKADGAHAQSQYKEGVDFIVRPAKGMARHPVLRGVPVLPVHDEVYRGMWFSPRITVLMETDHPLNDRPVVYIGPHEIARSVYIQLGHGEETIRHPGFRKLVHNAILWTARKME
jgi:type 1 glutamine amidotransferase